MDRTDVVLAILWLFNFITFIHGRILYRRIANLEIIIVEKVIGSGLARGLQRSDCQRSDGPGYGPKEQAARQAAAAWASEQAVQDGVEAYHRGYRPF